MSMSNAQAALIAAALTYEVGDNIEDVQHIASEHLSWLAAQDNTPEDDKPPRAQICGNVSPGNSTCDLPLDSEGKHEGKHHNIYHGTAWDTAPRVIDKPATVATKPVRHFAASPGAVHTACSKFARDVAYVSAFVRDVTCADCKEELGL